MSKTKLSSMEIDAIGEILNISLGASATAASTMLNARVDITTPIVQIKSRDEFEIDNLEPAVGVEITYVEGLTGSNVMLLKRGDVKFIVEKMMGMEIPDEEFELNEMNISAICEIMNQMMGASSTALAELFARTVNISTPVSFEVESSDQFVDKYFANEDPMVVVRFNLQIGDEMESEFLNVMPTALAKDLVSGFFPEGTLVSEDGAEAEPEPAPTADSADSAAVADGGGGVMSQEEIEKLLAGSAEPEAPAAPEPEPAADAGGGGVMSQEEIEKLLAGSAAPEAPAQPAAAQPEAPAPQPAAPAAPAAAPQPVQMQQPAMAAAPAAMDPAAMGANTMMMQQMLEMMRQQMELQQQELQQLKSMQKASAAPRQIKVNPMPSPNLEGDEALLDPDANLDLIMGVPLDISVEIGRTKKLVRDILELNKGSLVVLNKLAGEQVDVFVNGQCIAKGDVVVVEDNFGVRITEILQEEIIVEPQ